MIESLIHYSLIFVINDGTQNLHLVPHIPYGLALESRGVFQDSTPQGWRGCISICKQ